MSLPFYKYVIKKQQTRGAVACYASENRKTDKRGRGGGEFSITNKRCHSFSFFLSFPSSYSSSSSFSFSVSSSSSSSSSFSSSFSIFFSLLFVSLFHVIDRVSLLSTLFINETATALRFSASFSRQFNSIQLNDHFETNC